jgi:hypothetical protein
VSTRIRRQVVVPGDLQGEISDEEERGKNGN